ncbi:MAG: hypothetical protein HYY91_05540 [Candidatus Omnitrophica bacterium]|nr:hypothetical protein [Candidatus Omnitrophota bacterium]
MALKIAVVSVICFLVNVPLGMWREHTKKFSWQWIVAIHASIPLIIALRIGLQLPLIAIPINIAAAILGQAVGARSEKKKRQTA